MQKQLLQLIGYVKIDPYICHMKIKELNSHLKTINKPFVMMLIGPPLSGKDTLIRQLDVDFKVISRDDILIDVADTSDYNLAFKTVDQKQVDEILKNTIKQLSESKENVIINMTNMTSKRRRQTLSNFKDHIKIGVIFPILSDDEYRTRNEKRNREEEKFIPEDVIKRMISNYQPIRKEEGFDRVISL